MVSGTSDPDTIVEIIDENLNVVGSIHATTHSTYSIPISFGNGAHTIVARAHDGAGNTSVSPGRSFTVNVPANAPNPPTFGAPLPNSAQPQAVTFSGTSDPGTEVYVYDGSTLLGSTAAPGGGWQLTANLTQGLHTNVHAHAVLNGVPGSDTYADPFTVDSTAPTIAVDTTLLPVYVSALSPDVTGEAHDDGPITAPPSVRGVVVQVYQYTSGAPVGNEVAAVCTGCGTQDASWSYTPGLPAGAYTVEVHSVDEVGNRSPGQRFTLVVV
jgi:hypothetical protein